MAANLNHPDPNAPLALVCDASKKAVGAVLEQMHCALGTILDLLYKSKTNGGKVMKFTPNYTFTKRNILVKKFWPLKARKAMLK